MNRVVRSTRVPIAELWSPRGQVTFPVSWHCPVVGFGGALGDHDLGADELVAPLPGPCSWDPAMLARFAHTPRARVGAHLGLARRSAW